MKIVIADANLAPLRSHLEEQLPADAEVLWPDPRDQAAIVAAVRGADVLVSGRCPAAVGEAGRDLKLVHAAGAGVDGIDVTGLPPGTIVANTFHHEDSIAEYVVASAILLRRGFLVQDSALRRDEWASPAHDPAAAWGGFAGDRDDRVRRLRAHRREHVVAVPRLRCSRGRRDPPW